MQNILLTIRYDGSDYHGWQVQPNAPTVQQELSDAVFKLTGSRSGIIGCSRTDSGVHANMFCCNFKSDTNIPVEKIPMGLNFYLPSSISVYNAEYVDEDFHSRYDAKGKEYIYLIYNGKYRNPFYDKKALFYPYKLDEQFLSKEAKAFIGVYDFSSFCSANTDVNDKTREIFDCSVERQGDLVRIKVRGNGFLYNMVRIMVGTLLYINQGKISAGEIPKIIEAKNRDKAGITAEACGLYLNKVFY